MKQTDARRQADSNKHDLLLPLPPTLHAMTANDEEEWADSALKPAESRQ
jgi:hypothetical protein